MLIVDSMPPSIHVFNVSHTAKPPKKGTKRNEAQKLKRINIITQNPTQNIKKLKE